MIWLYVYGVVLKQEFSQRGQRDLVFVSRAQAQGEHELRKERPWMVREQVTVRGRRRQSL
eukprot:80438-Hanusia_phi.AAC.1